MNTEKELWKLSESEGLELADPEEQGEIGTEEDEDEEDEDEDDEEDDDTEEEVEETV